MCIQFDNKNVYDGLYISEKRIKHSERSYQLRKILYKAASNEKKIMNVKRYYFIQI